MELVIGCITTKYADFTGRARRSELWLFFLACFIIYIVAAIVDVVLGLFSEDVGIGVISGLFSLAVTIPSLAVGARRLHDIERTGWWQLLNFIPFIGFIALVIMWVLPGTAGANDFGEDPLRA